MISLTDRERRYRNTEKGREWKRRSNQRRVASGQHAEAQARYQRRRAEERDQLLREELMARG